MTSIGELISKEDTSFSTLHVTKDFLNNATKISTKKNSPVRRRGVYYGWPLLKLSTVAQFVDQVQGRGKAAARIHPRVLFSARIFFNSFDFSLSKRKLVLSHGIAFLSASHWARHASNKGGIQSNLEQTVRCMVLSLWSWVVQVSVLGFSATSGEEAG